MESFIVFIHPLSEALETVRRTFIHGGKGDKSQNIVDITDVNIDRPALPEGPCLLVGDDLRSCFACLLKNPHFLRNNVTLSFFSKEHLSVPVKRRILDLVHTDFLISFEKPDLIKAVLVNALNKICSKAIKTSEVKDHSTVLELTEKSSPVENSITETYRYFVSLEKSNKKTHIAAVITFPQRQNYKKISPDILDDRSAIWPFTLYEVDSSTGMLDTILAANRPVESLGDDVIKGFNDGKKVLAVKSGQWNTFLEATRAKQAALHKLKPVKDERTFKKTG